MSSTPTVFFSYAWGDEHEKGESREKIVNELYKSLQQDNCKLVRDKYDLGYKGLISEFMGKIGQGKCIVVAISQKYVRSPYCMFELYEIGRNSNFDNHQFRKKVLPIMVEFIDFTKPKVIDEYLTYWEKEYTEWSELVSKRVGQLSIEKMQRYDKVKMVYQNFDKLTEWIIDMNTLSSTLLSADDFSEIKKEIKRMAALLQKDGSAQQAAQNNSKESYDKPVGVGNKFTINNEGAKIGQQNSGSTVNNNGANFSNN